MISKITTFSTVPIALICAIVLFVIGIIGHLIIYKPKIAKMKFAIGLLVFGVTFGLGGLGIDYEQKILKILGEA